MLSSPLIEAKIKKRGLQPDPVRGRAEGPSPPRAPRHRGAARGPHSPPTVPPEPLRPPPCPSERGTSGKGEEAPPQPRVPRLVRGSGRWGGGNPARNPPRQEPLGLSSRRGAPPPGERKGGDPRYLLVRHPGGLVQAEGAAGGAVLGHHAQPAGRAHQLLGVAGLAARHLPPSSSATATRSPPPTAGLAVPLTNHRQDPPERAGRDANRK